MVYSLESLYASGVKLERMCVCVYMCVCERERKKEREVLIEGGIEVSREGTGT